MDSSRWNLTGSPNQIRIMTEMLDAVKMPEDRLTLLPGTPELGWADLNTNASYAALAASEQTRAHTGHHGGEDRPHALEGPGEDGRRQTMALIYTGSGRIYVHSGLESRPEEAKVYGAAEVMHAFDIFGAFNDAIRNEFLRLWNVPDTTWWEVVNYSAEYWRLGGEAWMREGVQAYAPSLDYTRISGFVHDAGLEPEDVYRLLGFRRTDDQLVRYLPSTIYHEPRHRASRKVPAEVISKDGLRACRVCTP